MKFWEEVGLLSRLIKRLKKRSHLTPLCLLLCAGVYLYLFDPSRSGIYPRCPLFAFSGIKCASCGGLRAAHMLIHGRIAEAWHYNQLLFLIPLPLWLMWVCKQKFLRLVLGCLLTILCVAFIIWRNWEIYASFP